MFLALLILERCVGLVPPGEADLAEWAEPEFSCLLSVEPPEVTLQAWAEAAVEREPRYWQEVTVSRSLACGTLLFSLFPPVTRNCQPWPCRSPLLRSS
jgi:hypothetical protein